MSGGAGSISADKARTHLAAIEQAGENIKVMPMQMNINFGEKFSEIACKEDEKTVVTLLKAFAVLGLSDEKVNEVMGLIAEEAAQVLAHQESPKQNSHIIGFP